MNTAIERVDAAFHFDAVKITFSLFALLQGMEKVREMHRGSYDALQGLDAETRKTLAWSEGILVAPSYLDLHPNLSGVSNLDLISQGGDVEQLAYRGWVVGLYALWENPSRGDLKRACETEMELANALNPELKFVHPQVTPMGDLRRIRNDIVHKGAVASVEETGKCQVLKWFKPGEQIVLNTDHVLDFLNHAGFLCSTGTFRLVLNEDGAPVGCVSWWFPFFESVLKRNSAVRIVSVRTEVDTARDSTELLCLFSIVYSNGFYASHCSSAGLPDTAENRAYLQSLLDGVYITPDGDMEGPERWLCVKASDAYYCSVIWEKKRRKGETVQDFPVPDGGFPGPWVKFRE